MTGACWMPDGTYRRYEDGKSYATVRPVGHLFAWYIGRQLGGYAGDEGTARALAENVLRGAGRCVRDLDAQSPGGAE